MHNFNKALKTSLIFLLLVILISGAVAYPYFHAETYHYQDGYVRDSLAGSLDLIICGASQAQRGISPAVLDEALGCNSYNIGSPLMTMKARYTILNKELSRNDVELVILELCYDTMVRDRDVVGPEGDLYMMGRFTSFGEGLSYFLSAARLEEYADFYYDILNRGRYARQNWGSYPTGSSESYKTKGFAPLDPVAIEMIPEENLHREAILTDIVDENREYLEKCLALCKEKEIPVIIVATPLSDAAILSYDSLDVIHDFYTGISEEWGCEYYNFSLYKGKSEIFPDSGAYYDRNHLGAPGAEVFSEVLAQVVENSRAGIDSSDLFYESYAEAEQAEILPRYGWK